LEGVSGTSTSNPSIAITRHDRRNALRIGPVATVEASGPPSPAIGVATDSKISRITPDPSLLRAWVIALAEGGLQDASRHPHVSKDPVTFWATSS
jgi:hypothetical protein